jgi:hypothetical protein
VLLRRKYWKTLFLAPSSFHLDLPEFDVAVLTTGGDGFAVQPGDRVDLERK